MTTLYVAPQDCPAFPAGNNANNGSNPQTAMATVQGALEKIRPMLAPGVGNFIYVLPGHIEEAAHVWHATPGMIMIRGMGANLDPNAVDPGQVVWKCGVSPFEPPSRQALIIKDGPTVHLENMTIDIPGGGTALISSTFATGAFLNLWFSITALFASQVSLIRADTEGLAGIDGDIRIFGPGGRSAFVVDEGFFRFNSAVIRLMNNGIEWSGATLESVAGRVRSDHMVIVDPNGNPPPAVIGKRFTADLGSNLIFSNGHPNNIIPGTIPGVPTGGSLVNGSFQ